MVLTNLINKVRNASPSQQKNFEYASFVFIIINSINTSLMLSELNDTLKIIDSICIFIFSLEITIRVIYAQSLKNIFSNGFLILDFIILTCCLIPCEMISDSEISYGLRMVRLLRIIRIVSINSEMHTITRVLLKSFVSLNKVLALLLLFIYIFSVIGVLLFKLPDERTMTENERITFQYFKTRAKSYVNKNMEPFGSISESMFTLFRIITGDNWTTYRYQLVLASKKNLISTPSWIITSYFILWMILGAYLLLNLILGAILHNYEVFFKEMRSEREIAREKEIDSKVTILLDSIKTSLTDSKLSEQEKSEIINKAIEIMKRET